VDIPIIGVGGISSAQDVIDFILCGASAVQLLSSAMLKGKSLYGKIVKELPGVMEKNGFSDLISIRGKALGNNRVVSFKKSVPIINEAVCTLCQLCVDNCPYNALKEIEKRIDVDTDRCFGCGLCQSRCPVNAIGGVLFS
jgi:Pyruvate/2-oxoacid:ferredoxin oxidoreductase delta subunit